MVCVRARASVMSWKKRGGKKTADQTGEKRPAFFTDLAVPALPRRSLSSHSSLTFQTSPRLQSGRAGPSASAPLARAHPAGCQQRLSGPADVQEGEALSSETRFIQRPADIWFACPPLRIPIISTSLRRLRVWYSVFTHAYALSPPNRVCF